MRGPTVSSEGSISKGSGLMLLGRISLTFSLSSSFPSFSFEVFVSIAAGLCFRCCCCCCFPCCRPSRTEVTVSGGAFLSGGKGAGASPAAPPPPEEEEDGGGALLLLLPLLTPPPSSNAWKAEPRPLPLPALFPEDGREELFPAPPPPSPPLPSPLPENGDRP